MPGGAVSPEGIPECAVLGAGTMGAQIALALAVGGAKVRLWGRRREALPDARARIDAAAAFLAAQRLQDQAQAIADEHIAVTDEFEEAVRDAGFIIEAVAEDIAIKQSVLGMAEVACQGEAILSSTTSAISASNIQAALSYPDRFCIAHYAQPAHLIALVEVVPGEKTVTRTTDKVVSLLRNTGKAPVLCPDIPGFLWARIQHAVLREFASLVGKGIVTPEACDTILKQGYAWRLPAMGAFEHADLAGLDLMNGDAAKEVWADLSNVSDPAETPVGQLFAKGHTGMGSGRGFYDWTVRDAEEFKAQRDLEIVRRIRARMPRDA